MHFARPADVRHCRRPTWGVTRPGGVTTTILARLSLIRRRAVTGSCDACVGLEGRSAPGRPPVHLLDALHPSRAADPHLDDAARLPVCTLVDAPAFASDRCCADRTPARPPNGPWAVTGNHGPNEVSVAQKEETGRLTGESPIDPAAPVEAAAAVCDSDPPFAEDTQIDLHPEVARSLVPSVNGESSIQP